MVSFSRKCVISFYFEQLKVISVLGVICIVNVLGDLMKFKFLIVGLLLSFPVTSLANDIVDATPVGEIEAGCASVVCKNVIVEESVTKAGEFPERTGNETLSAIGNVLFIAGEIGFAENLQEEEFDNGVTE